jgi:hypothetical protein
MQNIRAGTYHTNVNGSIGSMIWGLNGINLAGSSLSVQNDGNIVL